MSAEAEQIFARWHVEVAGWCSDEQS